MQDDSIIFKAQLMPK
jgi:5'-3' exoribonuclease 1